MQVNFIGHGLDPKNENTVGNILATSFGENKFDSFTGLVAFASYAGVNKLVPSINIAKKKYEKLNFFIGVDDNGTSKDALEELIRNEIETYIFHTQSAMIFHPKIFLFEGKNWNRLIIGSTNLTSSGLFVNVEGAISLDFRPSDAQGIKIINQFKLYFEDLLNKTHQNIEKLTTEFLDILISQGLVRKEINTRFKSDDEIENLENLELFPEIEKLNLKNLELGNLDLPEELENDRDYDIQFTANSLEKFPILFERWKEYKKHNPKSGGVVKKDTDDRTLFTWFRNIKYLINNNREIPLLIMKQLEESDFPFEDGKLVKSRIRWKERFEDLVAYKTKHKMDFAHIPQTKNQNSPYYSLGTWCALQKLRRKGIRPPIWTEYEEQKMNEINFLWETFGSKISGTPLDRKWFENYFKLEAYKTKTGNANPSQIDKDLEIKKLGKWVNDQRTLRNTGRKKANGEIIKLAKEREEWLIDLGVDFDYQLNIRKANLEKFIATYLEFRKEYPDGKGVRGDIRFSKMLEIKASIKYNYKDDKSEEGKWRIDRLNEIGFDWT
jgi:HKD family nuclease